MDLSLLSQLAPLGVGGIIAGIVMLWKRADDIRYSEREKDVSAERLAQSEKLLAVLDANTKALVALQEAVSHARTVAEIEAKVTEALAAIVRAD